MKERAPITTPHAFLAGGGTAGALARSTDWSATAVGAISSWPISLKSIVGTILHSRQPMFLWWGPELVQFYNDAYPTLAAGIAHEINNPLTVPTELKYFNAAGTNVKTETRTGYTCSTTGICTPGEKKMVDNVKVGSSTKMVRVKWKVDEAISDDLFSKLKLGE